VGNSKGFLAGDVSQSNLQSDKSQGREVRKSSSRSPVVVTRLGCRFFAGKRLIPAGAIVRA